jgi:hypothetical protein
MGIADTYCGQPGPTSVRSGWPLCVCVCLLPADVDRDALGRFHYPICLRITLTKPFGPFLPSKIRKIAIAVSGWRRNGCKRPTRSERERPENGLQRWFMISPRQELG